MGNFKYKTGSSGHFGVLLLKGVLPNRRRILPKKLLYLLIAGPALFSSCTRAPLGKDPSSEAQIKDSLYLAIDIDPNGTENLDLLLYEESNIHSLLGYCRIDEPSKKQNVLFEIEKDQGNYRLVFIANYPGKIPLASLQRYEAALQLKAAFRSERLNAAMMAGEFTFCTETIGKHRFAPQDVLKLEFKKLLSFVELSAVSNSMDGYELLEAARIRLRNINSSALLLQKDKFYPSEWIEEGEWTELGCDIGFYTQYPHIRLPCYPISDKSSPIHTEMELECRIQGKLCSFVVEIPLIERDSCVEIELYIDGPESYSSIIRQIRADNL